MNRFDSTKFFVLFSIILVAGDVASRGPGIKAGKGRLHPLMNLDVIWNSNPGYRNADVVSDLILRFQPGLSLHLPSERLDFKLDSRIGYDLFLGMNDSNSVNSKDWSGFSGDADLKLDLNSEGPYGLTVTDTFTRSSDPSYTGAAQRLDKINNDARVLFHLKPGGGALSFDVGYGFLYERYDEANYSGFNSMGHRFYFVGLWKFLPKTVVELRFDADLRRFPDLNANPDANAIRATLGLVGQISPTISVILRAGYGDSLLSGGSLGGGDYIATDAGYRSVIGQAEATYRLGTTFVKGGYERTVVPVSPFGYMGLDRFYAELQQQLMGRFSLAAGLGLDLRSFGTSVVGTDGSRQDFVLEGSLSAEYHWIDWLALGLHYDLEILNSDWDSADYSQHVFTLQIHVDY